MKERKILTKVLAMFLLVVIAMPSFSQVIAATMDEVGAASSDTAKFGISFLNKNGWGYKIQNRLTYRTYEITDSGNNYDRNIYCLDFSKRFPNEDSNKNTYTRKGDLPSSLENKERIRLIAENMYLMNMTDDEKDAILSKMFQELITQTSTDANPVTLEFIKKTINEDDIFFAQQCAIWKYTNNVEWQGAAIWLANKENPADNEWYQISNVGEARFAFMQEIYNYLTGSKIVSESSLTNPSLIKNTKTSEETEDGYIVGPFHIKSGSNPDYKVSLEDQSGAALTNYVLVDKDGNRLSTKLENTLDKDFYVLVPLKTQTTKVVLKLSYNSYKTTTSVWENEEINSQPLLEVNREKVPGNDSDEAPIEKPEKIYDLALRKYIVKVGDKDITERTPKIAYSNTNKEITYKHKKDPVVLKAGDTVIYDITVYNEGNQKATATRVKDILPEGLEFVKNSTLNRKYGWISSQDGSYIITSYTKDYELDAFDSTTKRLSSITIQVECRVKENVTSGVLTNIAEIVEDNIDDIDSTPGTINVPRSNLPDYKGKDTNKDDLTDSGYFYRGQEDDDDFEKVTVEEPKILLDLALRKYVSNINGKNQNREPIVDVTNLKNGTATTATYMHSKNPIEVKKGDIVTYSIRVYNEGSEDAYANEITDYIPEGLGFVVNHKINYTNNWKVVENTTNKIVKLNTIENATKNLSLSDFQGVNSLDDVDVVTGKATIKTNKLQYKTGTTENLIEAFNNTKLEPSSKVVQVVCVVLTDEISKDTIKNIAAVTEEVDKDGKVREDRDSQPTEIDVDSYPDNTNIQDDDDFEKLVLTNKIYDLAMRKYITGLNDQEITDRVPQVEITSLANGTTTTAVYKHKKQPIEIKIGDRIVYTLRVYNEGNQDAKAGVIVEHLPAQLKFLPDDSVNKKYNWKKDGDNYTTDYLANTVIKAFDGTTIDNQFVQIAVQVVETENMPEKLTNIAEIAKITDRDDNNVTDRDSTPDNVRVPSDSELPTYKDNELDKEYIPGQEDDDDFEKVICIRKKYDLALKKFLTQVDGSEINPSRLQNVDTTPLKNGEKDATYSMDKTIVKVKTGSNVVYTIRVYNEGEADAYAEEVKDNIPEGLEFVTDSKINKQYRWKVEDGKVVTDYLSKAVNVDNKIPAFNKETGEISYKEVKVEFKMVSKEVKPITNIAEIKTDDGDDFDSTPDNDKPGEDDIDEESIIPARYDLALKKFLSQTEGMEISPSRLQKVDTTNLRNGGTDATYTLDKTPVKVRPETNVVYTIRVYNEGEVDAYAEEVKDNIPEGLEFVEGSSINNTYKWRVEDGKVVTNFLSKNVNPDKILKAFNPTTGEISYQEVKVEFKVVSKEAKIITNIAEIKTDDGDDFDSTPDNDNPDEDDQDYDRIIPSVYDLALQKFITKMGDKNIDSRIPLVTVDDEGHIVYNHSKEPVTATNQSTVVYTIRVYNEGTIAAYVEEVKDDIPEGLVFLPENEINKKYGWKLYDENGNEVNDIKNAKYVRTDYLSRAQSEARGENNELKPFDKALGVTDENPDYRDVEVAFQIDQSKMPATAKTIRNIAEITDDNGDDIDSTPDNDDPDEDDIDDEIIQLKYFDLSLLKYTSKVIVNEDGVIKERATGHDGSENPEPAVKVEINRKKLNKTTVTFVYTIKVTNEGEIEGYAKEIKDRIPEGLEFFAEDNPDWKITEEGVVTTDALANKLLKPGESATVQIALRWKKSESNMGMKINTAEISKDENPYGTPDIDSTPDNNKDGEDDQDTAPVLLSITTGSAPTYIVLSIVIMTILSTGVYAIKRFVL